MLKKCPKNVEFLSPHPLGLGAVCLFAHSLASPDSPFSPAVPWMNTPTPMDAVFQVSVCRSIYPKVSTFPKLPHKKSKN